MKRYPQPWRRRDGRYYYFSYRVGKDYVAKSTRCTTKKAARAFIETFMYRMGFSSRSLGGYCEPYFLWDSCPLVRHRLAEGKSIGRSHVWQQRRRLENYVFPDPIAKIPLMDLKRGDVIDWRDRIRAQTSPATVNNALKALKTVLKMAHFRNDMDRNPADGVGSIKTHIEEAGVFRHEELDMLFGSTHPFRDERERMTFLIASETAMRRGEIMALRWAEVLWDVPMIHVCRAWKRDVIGPPKSNKERKVPISDRLFEELRAYYGDVLTCREEDLVICEEDGSPVPLRAWSYWFVRAMRVAGLDKKGRNLRGHSFRHTRITFWQQQGIPSDIIMAWAGHSQRETTAGYIHHDDEYMVKMMRGL